MVLKPGCNGGYIRVYTPEYEIVSESFRYERSVYQPRNLALHS